MLYALAFSLVVLATLAVAMDCELAAGAFFLIGLYLFTF
jgi:hypothetical protein